MAKKSNAEYKADQLARKKARQEALGERDIVTPIPLSIWSMIQDLCKWHAFTDWRELLINMVRVAHAAGPEGTVLAKIPKCGFVPSEKQLRKVGKAPECSICKDLGDVCLECSEGYE
jgi:predicted Zn-ribbon and HTH transcriptional regulator